MRRIALKCQASHIWPAPPPAPRRGRRLPSGSTRPDPVRPLDLQPAQQTGINLAPRRGLRCIRLAVQRLDPPAFPRRAGKAAADLDAVAVQKIAQHPAPRELGRWRCNRPEIFQLQLRASRAKMFAFLMAASLEARFGGVDRSPRKVEWPTDTGSGYISRDTPSLRPRYRPGAADDARHSPAIQRQGGSRREHHQARRLQRKSFAGCRRRLRKPARLARPLQRHSPARRIALSFAQQSNREAVTGIWRATTARAKATRMAKIQFLLAERLPQTLITPSWRLMCRLRC